MSLSLGVALGATFLVVGAFGLCIGIVFRLTPLSGLSVVSLGIGVALILMALLVYIWRWAL